eukprot:4960788-Heterocapsa_arctica.AAC.1
MFVLECGCKCSAGVCPRKPTCGSSGQSSCFAAVADFAVVAWLQRRVRYALGHCICRYRASDAASRAGHPEAALHATLPAHARTHWAG